MRAKLLTLIVLIVVSTAVADAADTQARLEQIRERIAAIQAQMQEDRQTRDTQIAALATIERKISDIAARLEELNQGITHTKQRVATLSEQSAQQQRQLKERLERLAAQVRAAYRVGRQGRLQLILSQEDPAAIGRLLGYYQYYARAQSQAIGDVRVDLNQLRKTRATLSDKQQRLRKKRAERRAILARLESIRGERETTIQAIEARLAKRGDTLQQLRADERRLTGLIESLHKNLSPMPSPEQSFAQRKGRLPAPAIGRAIARFGDNKAGGRLQWEGRWIATPAGAPVKAVAPGRVVYVGWLYHYGLMVVLDHGDNYYTVYGHNQSIYVSVGEHVRAGEKLASAGNSGGHGSSGVYFEIRHGTTPLDPGDWLRF